MPYKHGSWGPEAKEHDQRMRPSRNAWMAGEYWELRLLTLGKLGGKCLRCGNNDYRVLQIDHVNGDGNEERREKRGGGMQRTIMREIIAGNKNGKYQLLCSNCNWIKRWENNETKKGRCKSGK